MSFNSLAISFSQRFSTLRLKPLLFISLGLISLLLSACGTGPAQQGKPDSESTKLVEAAQIQGFKQLGMLYTGGQPSSEALKKFAELGVETVIDLRRPKEGLEQEQAEVANLGLNYVNIPLGRELASPAEQLKFAKAFAAAKGQKVLLHCRSGNRVGMLWSLYQISNGVDAELAIEQGRAMGMKPGFEQAVRTTITKE